MRILYCGDVVGRSGREAVSGHLPRLRDELKVDFAAVNGENAAGGFGITPQICKDLYAAGADVILLGNHAWDQREIIGYIDSDPKMVRPLNYPQGTPGKGCRLFQLPDGRKIVVAQVMGRLFMDPLDDPFAAIDTALSPYPLGGAANAILVDIHAEATSEKMAFGHYLDGRASLVAGTHTHVPTADTMILLGGTAYQSDVGMCGDYDSVIGMKKAQPIERFKRKMPTERLGAAEGEGTLCAVLIETDDQTGLATLIEPVRAGGRLSETHPARAAAAT
jgi:metallophosphoesterase (TIGR00282 family)